MCTMRQGLAQVGQKKAPKVPRLGEITRYWQQTQRVEPVRPKWQITQRHSTCLKRTRHHLSSYIRTQALPQSRTFIKAMQVEVCSQAELLFRSHTNKLWCTVNNSSSINCILNKSPIRRAHHMDLPLRLSVVNSINLAEKSLLARLEDPHNLQNYHHLWLSINIKKLTTIDQL